MLASIVFYLVCYYFTKKSAVLLHKPKRIIRFLRWLGVACFILFIVTAVLQVLEAENYILASIDIDSFCRQPGYIIPNCLDLLLSCVFIYIGYHVSQGIKELRA